MNTHPDQPEWLSHVNASVLKQKLATAIIGMSAMAIAASDRIMPTATAKQGGHP